MSDDSSSTSDDSSPADDVVDLGDYNYPEVDTGGSENADFK
jgi:hypothetical protein